MRFHIGFSKRISLKWLLLIIGGLLAFFGIDKAFAASMSADSTSTYVVSPYGSIQGGGIETGDLINETSGTPYCTTWEGQRYCAFKTITSPYTVLGQGSNIKSARLRWTFSSSSMAKCSSSQAITFNFQLYLRTITSNSLPNLWDTSSLYQKFWIRSSQTNYDCSIISKESHVINVSCSIPNPTATVYFYIEKFNIPLASEFSTNGDPYYYNIGVMPISYSCGGLDTFAIMNNQNQNTQDIMNNQNQNTQDIMENNNQNTQNITNSIDDLTGVVNDTSVPNYEDLPQFVIENMVISSQSQKLFMLPIQLLNAVVSGSDTCSPLRIDLSSITALGGGQPYILEIPCMKDRIKNYIGSTWYEIFDYIMAAIVFYYVGTNIVLRIQQVMSGVDTLPSYYTSHGKTKTALVDSETGEVIGNG